MESDGIMRYIETVSIFKRKKNRNRSTSEILNNQFDLINLIKSGLRSDGPVLHYHQRTDLIFVYARFWNATFPSALYYIQCTLNKLIQFRAPKTQIHHCWLLYLHFREPKEDKNVSVERISWKGIWMIFYVIPRNRKRSEEKLRLIHYSHLLRETHSEVLQKFSFPLYNPIPQSIVNCGDHST